jgi:hypothetical protein
MRDRSVPCRVFVGYHKFLSSVRLLTLFRMKKRFRDVFGTAVILYPRLLSAVIVLLLIYYFFAIIGMECFHNVDLVNCCKNTSVSQFFNYVEDGSPVKASLLPYIASPSCWLIKP